MKKDSKADDTSSVTQETPDNCTQPMLVEDSSEKVAERDVKQETNCEQQSTATEESAKSSINSPPELTPANPPDSDAKTVEETVESVLEAEQVTDAPSDAVEAKDAKTENCGSDEDQKIEAVCAAEVKDTENSTSSVEEGMPTLLAEQPITVEQDTRTCNNTAENQDGDSTASRDVTEDDQMPQLDAEPVEERSQDVACEPQGGSADENQTVLTPDNSQSMQENTKPSEDADEENMDVESVDEANDETQDVTADSENPEKKAVVVSYEGGDSPDVDVIKNDESEAGTSRKKAVSRAQGLLRGAGQDRSQ